MLSARPFVLALLTLACAAASITHAEDKIQEQVVGPSYSPGNLYVVSGKGLRVATVTQKGSRFVVLIDNIEGQKFDEILNCAAELVPQFSQQGFVIGQTIKSSGPVAFSFDGSRYAYCAREGKDAVVILDGKEIFRAPNTYGSSPTVSQMCFTPDGKHLTFYTPTTDTMQSFSLVVDGERGPAVNVTPVLRYSPDGSRFAYVGGQPRNPEERILIVDGKQQAYAGVRPQFTPDNKHVVSTGVAADGRQTLLVDGEPILTEQTIDSFVISPTGDVAALVIKQGGVIRGLYMNGKEVAGGEGAANVVFSPDGKRWAASCRGEGGWLVSVDGKRGQEYASVNNVTFTADSSKSLYVAEAGNRKFVIVDGQEQDGGAIMRVPLMTSESGNGYAYAIGDNLGAIKVVTNGKVYPPMMDVRTVVISPDGSRHAFLSQADAMTANLYVDGELQKGVVGDQKQMFFSPDSKHFVAVARAEKGNYSILIDGQFVPFPSGAAYPQFAGFTADSRHLIWRANTQTKDGKGSMTWFIDAKPAVELDLLQHGLNACPVEMNGDGSITVLGRKNENLTRIRVTPASDSTVATMASDYQTKKAEADAAAAKAKADADAAAAKTKADAEQARKDAAAAKQKAREEAITAKKKAAEDAAAAKRAKQGK